MGYYGQWRPYVPVARRRRDAQAKMRKLQADGMDVQPVEIEGRKIAKTFWGAAWCDQMESHGDYSNRLPRGRTYVRNGSVCHLAIKKGRIDAMVSGSEIYEVVVKIDVLPATRWEQVKQCCRGQIGSLLELLQGRISSSVMEVVTDPKSGLFPSPREIHLDCDCPDYATMCKHVAAVLYGVGARLDLQPELLFLLRGVNHLDLITAPTEEVLAQTSGRGGRRRQVAEGDLSDVFGIELDADRPVQADSATPARVRSAAQKKTASKASSKADSRDEPKSSATARRKTRSNAALGATSKAASNAEAQANTDRTVAPRAVKKAIRKSQAAKNAADANASQPPGGAQPQGGGGHKRAAKKKASTTKPVKKKSVQKKSVRKKPSK